MSKRSGNLLIIDDNASVLNSLELFLKHHFEKIIALKTPNLIVSTLEKEPVDVILLDMNFTAGVNIGNEGLYWLGRILELDPQAVVVMITAYGDIDLAVKAIREGAFDFITKPWDNNRLLTTLQAALQLRLSKKEVTKLQLKEKQLREDLGRGYSTIVGDSAPMKQLLSKISKVAKTDASVLLVGENGTGKELVAREIHRLSLRHDKSFVNVDVGALTETLFESELFGHKKGAFTDAKEDRIGRFEAADEGTLFIDEIGNLGLSLQPKLLSAIEQRRITPLGSNCPVEVDIRLITATNKDLHEMVKNNIFREDLYYRINTVQIEIPPLRERGNDITKLAEYYLHYYARKYERCTLKFNNKTLEKLNNHAWPGNVRELRHAVEKAVILAESDELMPEDFHFTLSSDSIPLKNLSLKEAEKTLIINAMKNHRGNISEAARELGIGRQTLYRKIGKYGIL
ncbi:MAG: sigma-54-dependent Fis family transcriptional regulator [Bacteroidales bacterium]|nr:sigma-54-dependent Fis family transcriptional regulator [Bacteroidales bacterium]